MINLKNDYSVIIDKKIFYDLEKKLNNRYDGYGLDSETKKLNKLVKEKCNKDYGDEYEKCPVYKNR